MTAVSATYPFGACTDGGQPYLMGGPVWQLAVLDVELDMATAPLVAAILERARLDAGHRRGGRCFRRGALVPTVHDHDLLAHALNERFVEPQRPRRRPLTADLPPKAPRRDRLCGSGKGHRRRSSNVERTAG